MRNKEGRPRPILAVLEKVSAALGKREMLDFAVIFGNWKRIVGESLANNSSPAGLSRKTLAIEASEPVWVDSMSYMKREIIEKANRMLGRQAVTKISLSVKKAVAGGGENKPDTPAETELPRQAVKEAEDALKYIEDSQLRSAFKRVILKDISRKYSLDDKKKKP